MTVYALCCFVCVLLSCVYLYEKLISGLAYIIKAWVCGVGPCCALVPPKITMK